MLAVCVCVCGCWLLAVVWLSACLVAVHVAKLACHGRWGCKLNTCSGTLAYLVLAVGIWCRLLAFLVMPDDLSVALSLWPGSVLSQRRSLT